MPNSEFTFGCPECGQHISATTEYVGVETHCPTCNAEFVVPPPPPTSEPIHADSGTASSQRNPLFVPLVVVSGLLVLAAAGGGLYFARSVRNQPTAANIPTPLPHPTEIQQPPPPPASLTPAPTPNVPTPEFTEFLRVSRRMVSAMGTGVTFADFAQRLVEVNASAEETLPQIIDRAQKARIADFVLALHDAHSLWRYKISSDTDRMRLQTISGMYAPIDFPPQLGDRWNVHFPDLVTKYGLRDDKNFGSPIIDYGNRPEMLFDRALERVFDYATKRFRELQDVGRDGAASSDDKPEYLKRLERFDARSGS